MIAKNLVMQLVAKQDVKAQPRILHIFSISEVVQMFASKFQHAQKCF